MRQLLGNIEYPLSKYDFILTKYLNNSNRWGKKIVYRVSNRYSDKYVATTFGKDVHFYKFLETVNFLSNTGHIIPPIVNIFSEKRTAICQDMGGKILNKYLLANPQNSDAAITSVMKLLKRLNSLEQTDFPFEIPTIVKEGIELSEYFPKKFKFIPHTKKITTELYKKKIKFNYGCGIADPHILNFRILKKNNNKISAFITDFDDWTKHVNYYWALGYFYGSIRWLQKKDKIIAGKVEKNIVTAIINVDLKSEFMFLLGVLSSYLGYRNIILNSVIEKNTDFNRQKSIIFQLDNIVGLLGNKILNS